MSEQTGLSFAGLLRQLRAEARLTQEELAEAAGLSPRSISDLERGINRTARNDTALLLADALSLTGQSRTLFVAAARGKIPAATAVTATRPSADESGTYLPVLTDRFIGRSRELMEILALIKRHRLVTLTGTGGCGKTRLAIEVASDLAVSGDAGEVLYVDAAPLADATLIPDRVARAMGIRLASDQASADAFARVVGDHQIVAVLDNLEHLTDAAPVVANMLRAGPGLRLLATSRTPLHVRGEQLYPVTPLAVPEAGATLDSVAQVAAVELFADRASAANPDFKLTADVIPAVAEICHWLDGLPLAIELAATRVRVLPPQSLLARQDRRLDLLKGPAGDRPARHRTLRSTIDWSYQLLGEQVQATFRALGLFRGGWGLGAAALVCMRPDEVALLEDLGELINASLIEPAVEVDGNPRFRMLETVRELPLTSSPTAVKSRPLATGTRISPTGWPTRPHLA
jgi:predicted ATPase/DNA-binding XRE family transcriptional regulator